VHRNRIRLAIAPLLFAIALPPVIGLKRQEEPEPSEKQGSPETGSGTADSEEQTKQRFGFGVDFFDSPDGRMFRGGFNYNWAPVASFSFAATLPVVDSRLGDVAGSGVGDLLLRFNWTPAHKLTANPWVPNSLGTGVGLLIPTGDASKGTGGDQWVIVPTLGMVLRLGKRSSLLPQLQYMRSVSEGELAQGMETISVSLGILHVTRSQFWIQYTPALSYDAVAETNELDNTVILGQQFTRRFAASLELGTMNIGDAHHPPGEARELDYRATLKLHWIVAF